MNMVFDDKVTVMQVRPNYSIVYQFRPTLRLEKKQVKSQKLFVDFVRDLTTNWKDGDYFFKSEKGTFAYFTLKGNKVKLLKKSKLGNEYLCWQYFTDKLGDSDGSADKTFKKSILKLKIKVNRITRSKLKRK